MSFTPTSGQYAAIQVTPTNTAVTLPAINWTLNSTANSKDVSNFRDGRRRTPTLNDWSVSLTLVWDSAADPLLLVNGLLVQGTLIPIVTMFTDAAQTNTKAFSGPGIVSTITPKASGVEDVVMMDCLIEANGPLVIPTA